MAPKGASCVFILQLSKNTIPGHRFTMIHPDSRVEGDLGCVFFVVLVSDCFLEISARFDVSDQHLQVIQIVSEEPQYLLKDINESM